jgi:hypothetical protein
MKQIRLFLALVLSSGLAAVAQAQQPDSITVSRIAMCTAVVEREPSGEASQFPAETAKLYCFTELHGAAGEVTYAWFQGDSLRGEIKLNKRQSGRWRMWSNKTMTPDMAGAWTVEVRDASGRALKSVAFTFGEAKSEQ